MEQDRQFLRICEYSTRCVILVLVTIVLMAVTLSTLPFLTKALKAADQNKGDLPVQKLTDVPSMWAPARFTFYPQNSRG